MKTSRKGAALGQTSTTASAILFLLNGEWFLIHNFIVCLMHPPDSAVLGRILLLAFAIYLKEYAVSASCIEPLHMG
ncbi:MAG: hypothetical protein WAT12_15935 [Candidatus Nitrotoga sp.]